MSLLELVATACLLLAVAALLVGPLVLERRRRARRDREFAERAERMFAHYERKWLPETETTQ